MDLLEDIPEILELGTEAAATDLREVSGGKGGGRDKKKKEERKGKDLGNDQDG